MLKVLETFIVLFIISLDYYLFFFFNQQSSHVSDNKTYVYSLFSGCPPHFILPPLLCSYSFPSSCNAITIVVWMNNQAPSRHAPIIQFMFNRLFAFTSIVSHNFAFLSSLPSTLAILPILHFLSFFYIYVCIRIYPSTRSMK